MIDEQWIARWVDHAPLFLVGAALLVLAVWWLGQRRLSRQRALGRAALDALATRIGGSLALREEIELEAEGGAAGRWFGLRRGWGPRGGSRREGWILQMSTPLAGGTEGQDVQFLDLPRWLPGGMRARPFRESGVPMPAGWFTPKVAEALAAVRGCSPPGTRLSIESGRLLWTLDLDRDFRDIPPFARLSACLDAMAALAANVEPGGAMRSASRPAPAPALDTSAGGAPRRSLAPLRADMVLREGLPWLLLLGASWWFGVDGLALTLALAAELLLINLLSVAMFPELGRAKQGRDTIGSIVVILALLPLILVSSSAALGQELLPESLWARLLASLSPSTWGVAAIFSAVHVGMLWAAARRSEAPQREWVRQGVAQGATTLLGFVLQIVVLFGLALFAEPLGLVHASPAVGAALTAFVVATCRFVVALMLVARIPDDAWDDAVAAVRR
jgi:hypothetical protein